MNKHLQVSLTMLAAAVVLLLGITTPATAQYVISAQGGLVNHATGPVSYRTSDDPTWKEVPTHLQLNESDRLKTQDWGKAELLLNPGSYLRIGNDAEIVVMSTELGMPAIGLFSGSAILEVADLFDQGTITVQTPITTVRIKKDGLYRIDVASDATTLTVRQGEAYFLQTDGKLQKVKKNRRALIIGQEQQVAKFDPDQVDDFDLWSADRAELLLAANQSFIRRTDSWNWPHLSRSTWIYDPFFGCYTFFPWEYGYRSPYGYGYYFPWYGRGYYYGGGGWYGTPRSGGFYGGQNGSSGPGGTPPTRAVKPGDSIKTKLDPDRSISIGPGVGIGRPGRGVPSSGSPRWGGSVRPGGSIGSQPSSGGKFGSTSGRVSGGTASGSVSGGAKASGGHGKR